MLSYATCTCEQPISPLIVPPCVFQIVMLSEFLLASYRELQCTGCKSFHFLFWLPVDIARKLEHCLWMSSLLFLPTITSVSIFDSLLLAQFFFDILYSMAGSAVEANVYGRFKCLVLADPPAPEPAIHTLTFHGVNLLLFSQCITGSNISIYL